MFITLTPDGLRVDGHQVGGEGDEVVAGWLGREVSRLSVHDVIRVDFAEGAAKQMKKYCFVILPEWGWINLFNWNGDLFGVC